MRCLFIIVFAAISFQSVGQGEYRAYDFSNVNLAAIDKDKLALTLDSVYRASGYDSLVQLYTLMRYNNSIDKHFSFVIGYQSNQSSFGHLKSGLAALGFPDVPQRIGSLPFGFELRGKHVLAMLYFVPGFEKTVKNDDYSVTVGGDMVELGAGYNLIKQGRVQFYPQLTFAVTHTEVDVFRKQASTDVVAVDDLVLNSAGTNLRSRQFDLVYGAELDYRISNGDSGLIIGVRYGRALHLNDSKFKIEGKSSAFKSDDTFRDSLLAIVLKLYAGE